MGARRAASEPEPRPAGAVRAAGAARLAGGVPTGADERSGLHQLQRTVGNQALVRRLAVPVQPAKHKGGSKAAAKKAPAKKAAKKSGVLAVPVPDRKRAGRPAAATMRGGRRSGGPRRSASRRRARGSATATVHVRADGTISGLTVGHRGSSNVAGTQGHHRTAHIVFVDAIRSHIQDRTVADAVAHLAVYLDHIADLPAMKAGGPTALGLAPQVVRLRSGLVNPANGNQAYLESAITEVLKLRNLVPGTAVRRTGSVKGEADHTILVLCENALREWEDGDQQTEKDDALPYDADKVLDAAPKLMWQLLDYEPAVDEDVAAVTRVIDTHLRELKQAYGLLYIWLELDKDEDPVDYILDHQGEARMPMGLLNPATLRTACGK